MENRKITNNKKFAGPFGPGRVRACNIALGVGLWVLNMKLFSRSGGGPWAPWRGFFAALTSRCTTSESVEAPGSSPSHPLEPRFSVFFQSFPASWKPEPAPDVPTSFPNLSKKVFSLLGPLKIDFPSRQTPENRYYPPKP